VRTLTAGRCPIQISPTAEFKYEPRDVLTLADADAWKHDQTVALSVAINSVLALKASHILRYSAAPPVGFETAGTIHGHLARRQDVAEAGTVRHAPPSGGEIPASVEGIGARTRP